MIEQVFSLSREDDKAIEKIIFDENVHYLHMVFPKNEGLPEHFCNANLYMTVIRGPSGWATRISTYTAPALC